ncbi:hypothetical protein P22_2436 [Propionispora sp. 2/2-37]|uniref:divergent polysaccharide deacetylase family protein n=1 Tax=Propionispora sp. 2/2-37 TaxID=1677858 RepID=UPI0006BB80EB|nr:divergent polysaccharide deacetylase family protein [Propionispora sp. 2/2-37]CUH96346.1 hypothetical protein P22_2436 [Propionispora sp. 2/2-37]
MLQYRKSLVWFLAVILAGFAVLYGFYRQGYRPNADKSYEIQKTGAGSVVDFTAVSREIHAAVDTVLRKKQLVLENQKELEQEVAKPGMEGLVKWHMRQGSLKGLDGQAVKELEQAFEEMPLATEIKVLAVEKAAYQGQEAVRIDIGLRQQLEGEDITAVTDQIFLLKKNGILSGAQQQVRKTGEKGLMAVIIDDFGYHQEPIKAFSEIDRPLTFAVLPYRFFTNEAAVNGLQSGHQVILHLPMEPIDTAMQSEARTITVNMGNEEIQKAVKEAIQSVPGIIGVNNHQGSKATENGRVMEQVVTVMKDAGLFFVDSRTSSRSVAMKVARQMGVPTTENALFLDNDNAVDAIKKQLRNAGDRAIQRGSVTVIGHARMTTAQALREMIPELEGRGIKFVFVADLL